MKSNVEMKVNVTLSFEELDFLSSVLCGLTMYSRDELKRMLHVQDFNRYDLESCAIQFSKLFEKCVKAKKCYER